MIRYYDPNLDLAAARYLFGGRSGEEEVRRYFARLTGKRHILLTSSCRAALYLTYRAMEEKGEVLVSPLTCAVAVLPLRLAGHTPVYVDIDPLTLNLDPERLPESVSPQTRAIQTINLGGYPCEMDRIVEYAERHRLLLVEDCAQGFGSTFDGRPLGCFGQVACFTLSKNAYGIGGGVLATNDQAIFDRAREIQNTWAPLSRSVLLFRTLRGLMESRRGSGLVNRLHHTLLRARTWFRARPESGVGSGAAAVESLLRKPRAAMFRISRHQLRRVSRLHGQRMDAAHQLVRRLEAEGISVQKGPAGRNHHAVCKLFVRIPGLPGDALGELAGAGIEAKHLEQKHAASVQPRFDRDPLLASPSLDHCPIYRQLHDELLSLPLFEAMDPDEIRRVAESVAGLRERCVPERSAAAPGSHGELAPGQEVGEAWHPVGERITS